jgi:hypothetical protein
MDSSAWRKLIARATAERGDIEGRAYEVACKNDARRMFFISRVLVEDSDDVSLQALGKMLDSPEYVAPCLDDAEEAIRSLRHDPNGATW